MRLLLSASFLCLLLPSLHANDVVTIQKTGDSSNRIDLVFVADGYTAEEQDKFAADVQKIVDGAFAQEPWKEYKNYFNVHRIDVASPESGADHPERNPAVYKNTAFDATYNCGAIQRLICVDVGAVLDAAAAALQPSQRDMLVVVVNDPEYGGSGGSVAVTSVHADAVELVLHEVGHSFALLADEYGGGQGPSCSGGIEPPEANATKETERDRIKWKLWIDASTMLPTTTTTAAVPGAYQGSRYCDVGLYRPTYNSKMRSLGFPYEQINTERFVVRFYAFVSPIDAVSPSAQALSLVRGTTRVFTVTATHPATHGLEILWSVDGETRGTAAQLSLDTTTLSPGSHTVEVEVRDPTTMVRNDPNQALIETRAWTVFIGSEVTSAAHVAWGGAYQTALMLANTGGSTASGAIDLTRSDGTPGLASFQDGTASATAQSSFSFSIPAGGLKVIRISAAKAGDSVLTGWAAVTSDGRVSGVAIFTQRTDGSSSEGPLEATTGVLFSSPVSAATIGVDNSASERRYVGFAVANPGDETLALRLRTLSTSGTVVDDVLPAQLSLSPRGHASIFLHEIVSNRTEFKGSMVLAAPAGRTFLATALLEDRGQLTAIPVLEGKAP